MSHLGENLASKGFVVVVDRSQGQHLRRSEGVRQHALQPAVRSAVRAERDRRAWARPASGSFLAGLVDAGRTGIVGYSMGGYGVVNVIGGGYSDASADASRRAAEPAARRARRRESPAIGRRVDPRIKAAIAIAPWGMQTGFWDAEGLKGITHADAVRRRQRRRRGRDTRRARRAIFQGAVNADRYLLTFINANHNAGAPIPAPAETYAYSETLHGRSRSRTTPTRSGTRRA